MSGDPRARPISAREELARTEREYERVLAQRPNDVEALNVVAMAALRRGEMLRALTLLAHAATVNPEDAITQHHLGRAREQGGDLAAAITAYTRAVQLKPDFYLARLHLAAALESAGEHFKALLQYSRTLRDAQSAGKYLDRSTTPPGAVRLVEHAVQVVRGGRRALFSGLLEPLRERFGRDALVRVERGLRMYLGEEAPEYVDPRQRPTFFLVPGLPTTPYFARALLPWAEELEAQTAAIRGELEALLASEHGRERVFTSDELERENLRGGERPPSWNGYYFYRYGERREETCTRCPRTAEALERLPLSRVAKHAPEALFSVFTAGTHLLPHRGVTNTRVVGHLPLIVPPDCALAVGGESHAWQEGRAVVFDDTYEHEAWNRSERTRVVLIFDLWNPHLTAAEREAVRLLVEQIGEFRELMDAA